MMILYKYVSYLSFQWKFLISVIKEFSGTLITFHYRQNVQMNTFEASLYDTVYEDYLQ